MLPPRAKCPPSDSRKPRPDPRSARTGRMMKKDPTKPVNPFEKKSSKFIERRKKLMGIKSALGKAGKIGAAITALGIAGAGAAKVGQMLGKKMDKKNKKMGGGMMMRPRPFNEGGVSKEEAEALRKKAFLKKLNVSRSQMQVKAGREKAKKVIGKLKNFKNQSKGFLKEMTGFNKGGGYDAGTPGKIRDMYKDDGVTLRKPKLIGPGDPRYGRSQKHFKAEDRKRKIKQGLGKIASVAKTVLPGAAAVSTATTVFKKLKDKKTQGTSISGKGPRTRQKRRGTPVVRGLENTSRNPNPKTPKMMNIGGSVTVKTKIGKNFPTKTY